MLTFLVILPLLGLVSELPAVSLWALLGAGGWVAVIGFLDDLRDIPPLWRLLGHFIGAGWARELQV